MKASKRTQIIIFFSIFFTVYFLSNFFIYKQGLNLIKDFSCFKVLYNSVFLLLSLSYIIARLTGKKKYFGLHKISMWLGSYWLVAAIYFLFIILILKILKLFISYFTLIEFFQYKYGINFGFVILLIVILIVAILLMYGSYNAKKPLIKFIKIKIDKNAFNYNSLKIALISDTHIGTLVNGKYLQKLVSTINDHNVDIVLIAGDILDEELSSVLLNDYGSPLRNIKAKSGVWAVTGNHEYIGNIYKAEKYIESLNINILKDNYICIDDSFYIIGRNDKDSTRFGYKNENPWQKSFKMLISLS